MNDEPRSSPLVSQIALWIVFAAIAVASVFTVLIPELRDDAGEEAAAGEAEAGEASN
jgi:hypothetical protein